MAPAPVRPLSPLPLPLALPSSPSTHPTPPPQTLTFKGPAAPKRASKPVVRLDPIVPRTRPASASTSTEPKKRRLSTARDDSRSPDKPARRARVSDDDEGKDEDELEIPVKKKQKGKGVERVPEGDKKAPTKRVKAVEHDEGSSTGASLFPAPLLSGAADVPVRDPAGAPVTHEERVSRDTVDKRWQHISASTSAVLRQRVQDVIECVLLSPSMLSRRSVDAALWLARARRDTLRKTWPGSATDKSRQAARKMLNDFTDECVPSSLSSSSLGPPLAHADAPFASSRAQGRRCSRSRRRPAAPEQPAAGAQGQGQGWQGRPRQGARRGRPAGPPRASLVLPPSLPPSLSRVRRLDS